MSFLNMICVFFMPRKLRGLQVRSRNSVFIAPCCCLLITAGKQCVSSIREAKWGDFI